MTNQKESYKEPIDRATAVFQTNLGTFEAELFAKECPETVWNFINLAEGRQTTARGGNYCFDIPQHYEHYVEAMTEQIGPAENKNSGT